MTCPDHPRFHIATWICMCDHILQDSSISVQGFWSLRGSKFSLSHYFGYWLLQAVIANHNSAPWPHLRSDGRLPDEPGLAGVSSFHMSYQKRTVGEKCNSLPSAGCTSCHQPTVSNSNDSDQSKSFLHQPTESHWFANASTQTRWLYCVECPQ